MNTAGWVSSYTGESIPEAEMRKLDRELIGELRDWLQNSLPDYMVPGVITMLDELPLSPNGKIDRVALAQLPLEPERLADDEICAAYTPLEKLLVGLWAEVANQESVGVRDDFFALGGNSLQAMTLVARLQRRLSREIQPPSRV